MKKFLKIAGIIAGIFIVILIAAALILPSLIPQDKIKTWVTDEIGKTIGRQVSVGTVKFNIFTGLSLTDFRISDNPAFSKEDFIAAKGVTAGYSLWSLLRGKLLITGIVLNQPSILVEVNKSKAFNFSDIQQKYSKPAKPEAAPAKPVKLPFEIAVAKISVTKGRIIFRDNSGPAAMLVDMADTNLSLIGFSLDPNRTMALDGSTVVNFEKGASRAGEKPLKFSLPLTLAGRAKLDLAKETLTLEKADCRAAGVLATASGKMDNLFSSRRTALDIKADIDARQVMDFCASMLPEKAVMFKEISVSGKGSATMKVEGSIQPMDLGISGDASIKEVEIKMADKFKKTRNMAVGMSLKGKYTDTGFDIASCQLNVMSAAIKTKGKFAMPAMTIDLSGDSGDIDLAEMVSMSPMTADMVKVSGKAKIKSFSIAGKPQDLKTLKLKVLASLSNVGAMPAQIKYGMSGLQVPSVTMTEQSLQVPDISFKLGSSAFSGNLSANNFRLEDMPDWQTKLKIDAVLNLNCPKFNTEEVMAAMPKKEKSSSGKSAAGKAGIDKKAVQEKVQLVPAGLSANARLTIADMVFRKMKMTGLDVSLVFRNRQGNLTVNRLNAYQGDIKGRMDADLNNLTYALNASLEGFNFQGLGNDAVDSFLEGKPDYKDKIFGTARAGLNFSGAGILPEEIMKSVKGKLTFQLKDGKLVGIPVMQDLAAKTKIDALREMSYSEFTGDISAADEKATVNVFQLLGSDIKVRMTGYANYDKGMDSALDLKVATDLSPKASQSLPASYNVSQYIGDKNGWMPLDIKIGGTLDKRTYGVDMSRATENAKQRAVDAAKKAVDDKKKETENKAKDELQKSGKKLLKGLFGK